MKTFLNLRNALLLVGALIFSVNTNAQDQQQHEIGLRLSGLQDFDFIYKKQKAENKWKRYRFAFVNAGYNSSFSNDLISFGFGVGIGVEKRKSLNKNLFFIHGWEPRISLGYRQYKSNEPNNPNPKRTNFDLRPGIGYVLGFHYQVSDKFHINLEAIPSINANFSFDNDDVKDDFSIDAGFNSNAIAVSLIYRFQLQSKS